jgi:hypothetical protein
VSQQINLYNPIFLKQKKHFSARTMLQSLAAIVAGALAFYAYAVYQTGVLRQSSVQLEVRTKQQREQLVKLGRDYSPQGRSRLLEEELARAEARLKSRQALMERLHTEKLGSTDGFSQYLKALAKQPVAGVWLTGIKVGGDAQGTLAVQGRALQAHMVPAYLQALSGEPVMRGRAVTELKLSASKAGGAAKAAENKAAESKAPSRYVEFSVLMPRKAPEAAAPARKAGS